MADTGALLPIDPSQRGVVRVTEQQLAEAHLLDWRAFSQVAQDYMDSHPELEFERTDDILTGDMIIRWRPRT